MNGQDALHRLRRALARLARDPQARLRLCLANDPPHVDAVELVGVSTNHGLLTLHLVVQETEPAEAMPERTDPCSKLTSA